MMTELYDSLKIYDDFDSRMIKLIDAYFDGLESMKNYNQEAYREGIMKVRQILDYWHFDEDLLEEASEHMANEDGTEGFHFAKKQVEESMGRMGYNDMNINDMLYAVNMLYSDYSPMLGNDINTYTRMAKMFICDKDAPKGKAVKYYISMH